MGHKFDLFEFHSVEFQQKITMLFKALCCLQCQNQNAVESNANRAKLDKLRSRCRNNIEILFCIVRFFNYLKDILWIFLIFMY
ncbi:cytochrome c-type biogenesis protein CcmH [Vibrio alfacsensis]|uniref:cytochrome c-type biogenesis protein CcmH n=1 Tax=Vibrio alfacsensis TaxID=1074311 RepID=UPI00406832CD